jgi:hypothetical protein
MSYYIHVGGDGNGLGVWEITDTRVRRIDGAGIDYPRPAGVDVLQNIASTAPFSTVRQLRLAPGGYYSRMARPSSAYPRQSPGTTPDNATNRRAIAEALGQLSALQQQLESICQVVHPIAENLPTFGHEIRSLLLLACTEVETQWKSVLKAHSSRAENTSDYVKLAAAMKLPSYAIAFNFYPWLPPLRPFENWKLVSQKPSQDISWYSAYNATKHDRERALSQATLENALMATAACATIIVAQFGWVDSIRERAALNSYFEIAESPIWEPEDVYFHALIEHEPRFTTALTYPF